MKKIQNRKIIALMLLCICYKGYSAASDSKDKIDIKETLDSLEKESKGKELTLADIPQFKAFTSYIPKDIIDTLSKLRLNNIEVGFDTNTFTGIINAETEVLGVKGVIRLVVGLSNIIDKKNSSASLMNATTAFQNSKLNITKTKQLDTSKKNITKGGLTFYSDTKETITSGLKTAQETASKVTDKLVTTTKKISQKAKDAALALLRSKSAKNEKEVSNIETELDKVKSETKGGGMLGSILSKLAGLQLGISIVLPEGFSFTKLSNSLRFLDIIDFKEVAICLGTGFFDPIYGPTPPGLALITKIGITEPFAPINGFISKISNNKITLKSTDLELKGNITPYIGGSSLSLQIPGKLGFNLAGQPFLDAGKLGLYMTLLPMPEGSGTSGISLGISAGLDLYLNHINAKLKPLSFNGYLAVDTSGSAIVTGSMNGLLDLRPIGLPIQFGNITLQTGINPENVETLGLSEVGMAGEFDFGPKDKESKITAAFDVKLSGQQTNIMAYGEIQPTGSKKNALDLADILHLASSAYSHLEGKTDLFKNVPELGLKKAKFYFSPANVYFANKVWPSGLNVDAELDILGTVIDIEFNINQNGFDGTGYLSPITLGPVKITGAGTYKECPSEDPCLRSCITSAKTTSIKWLKPGTIRDPKAPKIKIKQEDAALVPDALKERKDPLKEKGAIVNINFYPLSLSAGIFISANISADLDKLGKVTSDSCISISTKGVQAQFSDKVFNVLDAQFTLSAKDFVKPKEWYVCARLEQKAIDMLNKELDKVIEQAKKEADQKISAAQQKVEATKKKFDSAMGTAQNALKKAQGTAADLKVKVDKARKECGL